MSKPNATQRRAIRVLIVEDEPRLRELLLDVVPTMGYEAVAARNAEEALRLMQTDAREVLLLDLQLPFMNGMDLLEKVREQWPATQAIILTGFGDLASARRAIHLDAVEFLSKPCPLGQMELAIERARRRLELLRHSEYGTLQSPQIEAEPAPPSVGAVSLWESERRQIMEALQRNAGNRTVAAVELGISRRTLHYRLREYRHLGYIPGD